MDVFLIHQLAIARKTMTYHCAGALIMGGMNHYEAVEVFKMAGRHRKSISVPVGCTCNKGHVS